MKLPSLAASLLILAFFTAHLAPAQTTPAAPSGAPHEHKPKVASTSLLITASGKSVTLKLADLQAMPQRTLVVHNGHTNIDEAYTGPGLDDLLAKVGTTLQSGGQKRVLHSYVRAEGTDKYFVLFSAAELEPALHAGDSIVALTLDSKPLTEDGQFKLIVQGDKKPARWVTNLSSLTIVTLE